MNHPLVRPRWPLLGLLILPFSLGAGEAPPVPPADNEELIQMYREDQADRQPEVYKKLGQMVSERDKQRQSRTMEIYQADGLKTGADYWNAAMIMQHGDSTEYYLLAHEFSMAALALGNDRARWLTAASYDRLLKSMGRSQRFGTQYSSKFPGGPQELYQVDANVTDSLRKVMKVPPLAEAKAREAELTKRYAGARAPTIKPVNFSADHPPPAEFDVLNLSGGDTPPEISSFSQPVYPEKLLSERPSGYAMISGVIERDGTLTQPKVAQTTHEAFGRAAEAAVATWKFKAGLRQGQPARVIVVIQINFAPPAAN